MLNSAVAKGSCLALITALISGVSIYVNSFGVKQVPDPFMFTTAKNLLVALALAGLALLPVTVGELGRLSRRQWAWLAALGLVGGSVPFLLFFYGLKEATAPTAALVHKTLFIWVAVLAVPLLGERVGRLQVVALAALAVGNLVLLGYPYRWGFGRGELLVLAATLCWAVEAVIARRVLQGLSARAGALGRMGFGSLIMLGFILASGRWETLATMTGPQWGWVVITSVLLLGYVSGYYAALKHAPATLVSSVLVVGSVVTSLLHAAFNGKTYSAEQAAGFGVVVMATLLWLYIGFSLSRRPTHAGEVAHARR